MILVILGTHTQPFNRLAKRVDEYALTIEEEIIVQKGVADYKMKYVTKSFDYCSKDEMNNYMNRADISIMQGGWGGMEEAIDLGKRIVAVPRIEGKEHIHNQEQLVRKLDDLGCVVGCFDMNDLFNCIEKARKFNFKKLKKGNATDIIRETINVWFN